MYIIYITLKLKQKLVEFYDIIILFDSKYMIMIFWNKLL